MPLSGRYEHIHKYCQNHVFFALARENSNINEHMIQGLAEIKSKLKIPIQTI